MLEEICAYLHNYFYVQGQIYRGRFTITGGVLTLPFVPLNGQYVRVMGSVLNDGVYKYPFVGEIFYNESFDGAICGMAVPREVRLLITEIEAWIAANPPAVYTAESFGGYSYTKAARANGAPIGWQEVFAPQLNRYRKLGNPDSGILLLEGERRGFSC